mmetsp:Transcript_101149/g.200910  ORF Transcript_101149/g.200910 Transcript_101149/m.200910 type:complete len:157 (+) Transcript_101149:112-582(+)
MPQAQAGEQKVFKTPSITTDAIVTKAKAEGGYEILLVTRGRPPFVGSYAFPGGFVDYGEDPEVGVLRELQEECNVEGRAPELICVAGKPDRDPRKHVISIVYSVVVDPAAQVSAGDDAATAHWYDLQTVWNEFELAFDHKDILHQFLQKKHPAVLG